MLGVVSKIYTGLLRIIIASAIISGVGRMDIRGLAESARVNLKEGLVVLPRLGQ
jgi:hypothetical protein